MKKYYKYVLLVIVTMVAFLVFNDNIYAASIGNQNFNFCSQNGVAKTFKILGSLLYLVKIFVPIGLIIFASIDFGKSVISNDEKAIKKSVSVIIKRGIAGVIIFFIPLIIHVVFSLVSGFSTTLETFEICESCLNNPTGDVCKANSN